MSPSVLSPTGDLEDNPFEAEFNGDYDYDDDDMDDGLDFSTPSIDAEINNFAVLNSSLPLADQLSEHHLTSYANAKRAWPAAKEKKQHRTKWHFGIRSRSPPMEVVLEIYRTLKMLGMEWKEKRNLGGLGGIRPQRQRSNTNGAKIERVKDLDGSDTVDLRAAASVYFIETRARVQDVVVRGDDDDADGADVDPFVIGAHEPTALHGRLDQLPGRLSPQEDVQGVYGTGCWQVRHGEPRYAAA